MKRDSVIDLTVSSPPKKKSKSHKRRGAKAAANLEAASSFPPHLDPPDPLKQTVCLSLAISPSPSLFASSNVPSLASSSATTLTRLLSRSGLPSSSTSSSSSSSFSSSSTSSTSSASRLALSDDDDEDWRSQPVKKALARAVKDTSEEPFLFGQTPYQLFCSMYNIRDDKSENTTNPSLQRALSVPLAGMNNEEEEDGPPSEEAKHQLSALACGIDSTVPLIDTPPELSIPLYDHQKQGLGWMVSRENSASRGGLLADEMGLGKTLQVISLLLHNKPYLAERKTTLVVAPVAIVSQWRTEIKDRTLPYKLSVYTYHGDRRVKDAKFLAKHDVVITTYATLTHDFAQGDGALFQVYWFRVVLDESHVIKNKDTRAAQACYALESVRRWCISGTPIQNRAEDIFSTMKFLKLKPYDDLTNFRQLSRTSNNEAAVKRLKTVFSTFMLRRLKAVVLTEAQVPNKHVSVLDVETTEKERALYYCLEIETQREVQRLINAGNFMRSSSNIFVLLLRLRQVCNHVNLVPNIEQLIEAFGGWKGIKKRWKSYVTSASKRAEDLSVGVLSASVILRLMQIEDISSRECPICIDVCENAVVTKCGHVFCRACLQTFLTCDGEAETKPCPECRQGVCESELTAAVRVEEKQREIKKAKSRTVKPCVASDDEPFREQYGSKIAALVRFLESTQQENSLTKTIVFSQFTGMLNLAETALKERQMVFLRYDGTMSYAERERVLAEFKRDSTQTILLMSIKCGAYGLNLSHASKVVLLEASWNPFIEEQAIDRVHRIGQKTQVEVVKLKVTGSVEERIMALQERKKTVAGAFMGQGEGASFEKMSRQDLQHLFNVEPVLSCIGGRLILHALSWPMADAW